MATMYFRAIRPISTTGARRCRFRLPGLWLLRCFLPAWLRLSLPVPVTVKRLRDPLCVFILGMVDLYPVGQAASLPESRPKENSLPIRPVAGFSAGTGIVQNAQT